ncbi:hypothetical protein LTR08_004222 [Meristemomyces frigidus]|nr:hypothetical protein LTR08_004222 [Meristemomyces frigidus]
MEAAYRQGHASASAGRGVPTRTPLQMKIMEMGEDDYSLFGDLLWSFFYIPRLILAFCWSLLVAILAFFWNLVSAVLQTIWAYALWPTLMLAMLMMGLMIIFSLPEIALWANEKKRRLRERFDDYALENDRLLTLERNWARISRAWWGGQLWYQDKFQLLRQEIRIAYDSIMAYWPLVLFGLVTCAICMDKLTKLQEDDVKLTMWDDLPSALYEKVPMWAKFPRKTRGSSSHYVPREEEVGVVRYDEWVKGEATDVGVEAATEPAKGWFDAISTNASAEDNNPETTSASETSSITETSSDTPKTSATHQSKHVHPIHTDNQSSSARVSDEDYWAPPKRKSAIGSEESIWCRQCQQFHCCELPY